MIKISVDFFPGHYIYIEASSPRKPGDNAMLVSAQQPTPTSDQCFEFWYSMYGAETGTLNLYIEHGNQLGSPVWTKQGELEFIFLYNLKHFQIYIHLQVCVSKPHCYYSMLL